MLIEKEYDMNRTIDVIKLNDAFDVVHVNPSSAPPSCDVINDVMPHLLLYSRERDIY